MGQNEPQSLFFLIFFIKVAYYSYITSCCCSLDLVTKLFLSLTDVVGRATRKKRQKRENDQFLNAFFLSQQLKDTAYKYSIVLELVFMVKKKMELVNLADIHLLFGDSVWIYPSRSTVYQRFLLMSSLLRHACVQPGTQCTGRFPDIVGTRISDDIRVELIPATSNFGS